MKKLLWTSAIALTAMACLTACGDDDSGTSAGGDDELYTCDITAKKVVVKQNAGPYSVTMTYTHNEDGTMTTRYEYGSGHPDVCAGPVPNEIDDEDAEMTCKDNVYTVKSKVTVTTEEFQEYAGAATKACPEPASWGKDTKPSDDDDEAGTDDDGEGSTDGDGDVGPGNGGDGDYTCNFKKSDDVWKLVSDDGVMTVDWTGDEPVASTVQDMGEHTTCALIAEIYNGSNNKGESATCEGGVFTLKDSAIYKGKTKDEVYDIVTTNCKE